MLVTQFRRELIVPLYPEILKKYHEELGKNKAKWVLDPTHSELNFKVKHLMISNVKGEFKNFTAEIDHKDFKNGNEKAGFSFNGKINRKDWGLNWNTVLETGGVLVSDEVKIGGEVQFVKQA